ncbi:MAG: aldose 1-epimerase family protein [Microterricola sp.]
MTFPTGEQFELALQTPSGMLRAVITELAAGIRELSIDGVELMQGFDAEIAPPSCAGVLLMPWGNRIPDGVWVDAAGTSHQLAITEVDLNNAIHGLLRFAPYQVVERSDSAITLGAQVFPQLGYPFHLDTQVRYELVADGLSVTHTVRNVAAGDAPVTVASHPFLKIGGVPTEELVLTVNADTHIDVDERLNPTGLSAVAGTPFDLRADSPLSRRVGDLALDDAWGDSHVVDGETAHTLTAPDGRRVGIWGDENFGYVQVYITPTFPARGSRAGTNDGGEPGTADAVVTAIAIEPMTGPANAYNSGAGLKRVASGEEWVSRWGIRFAGFPSA